MRWLSFFYLFLCTRVIGQNAFPSIGQWREHLPYQSAISVAATDHMIYAATPFSLIQVNRTTEETNRISKISGLNATGISTIRFDSLTRNLYIGYTNSLIDVLNENGVFSIAGLQRDNQPGNKTIYNFYPANGLCYVSTGIGILVLDPAKKEVRESWFIDQGGNRAPVYDFTIWKGYYYAATDEGLKKAPLTGSDPADFRNWSLVPVGSSSGRFDAVATISDNLVALVHDSVFINRGVSWQLLFSNGWPVTNLTVSENRIMLSQRTAAGASQVLALDVNGTLVKTIQQPEVISLPRQAISVQGTYWVADQYGGLSEWKNNHFTQYKLNSPEDIATGQITIGNNKVYAAAGAVNESWNYQYNRNGLYLFENDKWTNINQFHVAGLDSVLDIVSIAVDPRDQSWWAGSFGGGLLHGRTDGKIDILKQNTPLAAAVGDPGSYRVAGLAFDEEQNLWISNFGSAQPLKVLKHDGTWQSFTLPLQLNFNATAAIVVDDASQEWIQSPLENGLIVFNHGASIENTADDRWILLKAGSLPSSTISSLAKDKSGFIWVGTSDGVAVFQCPESIFTTGCNAQLPIIKDGSFANYLFKGQTVRSIAVDGADRKWMATAQGVWLLNNDGTEVIYHFTEDNSPLLSNDVRSIAINGETGEVYFATARGLCSYRSTATEFLENKNSVLVFPNPVPPGYTGTIGIKGLPENSLVKIVELNGRLVYETRSLGGQAIWNGRDLNGNTISSGIYIVLAQDNTKQQKAVSKIVFISR